MNVGKHRRLVLVDLENLVGCRPTDASSALYGLALDLMDEALGLDASDLIVIDVNPALAYLVRELAPSVRIVTRCGRDGADLRLLSELRDMRFVARRFGEVVIASGDGIFVDVIIQLNEAGLITTVVAKRGHLSNSLRLAARSIVWLDERFVPLGTRRKLALRSAFGTPRRGRSGPWQQTGCRGS